MNTFAAIYKILENVIHKEIFLEQYENFSREDLAFEIGNLWNPDCIVFSVVMRMTDADEVFDALGGYQPLTQIHKLALGMALDAVIALGIYYTYNTFIPKEPTHHLRFTPKESGLQHDNNDTTNQTLTDLSPEIMPVGETPHSNSTDH